MKLVTTLGEFSHDQHGMILPHEHVFVDLRTPDVEGHGQAETDSVVRLMTPQLEQARASGVTALVECTPLGVGRRVDLVKAVSAAANLPVVVATGIYREPWVPEWARHASEQELYEWMLGELQGEIEGTGVRAGFIKVSAGDDGLTAAEIKILRAAARAAVKTGCAIGSHTIRGWVARNQLDIVDSLGLPPERFIWVHTQAEEDRTMHIELARRGAWIEYDWIGWTDDDWFIDLIHFALDAGLEDHLLLSMDRGWYDPAQPNGGEPKPYTHLPDVFLPRLNLSGVGGLTIQKLTHHNPFNAFARP